MNNKKRYSIAVLIGGAHTYFPQSLMDGIHQAAHELDVNIYFFPGTHTKVFFQHLFGNGISSDNDYDYQFNTVYDYSMLSGVDGVIIHCGMPDMYQTNNVLYSFTQKFHPLPVVLLTDITDRSNCHYLISDNYAGVHRIMEHLIQDHGYRKILYVSGPENNTDAAERKQGYLDAMDEAQLPHDDSMIAIGDYSEFVDAQVEQLLDAHPDAEAIAFANDEMALSGYRVCARRGLEVGKDIAITGYDDCKMARLMNPALTTVSLDGVAMGRQAVIDLCDRLEGKAVYSRRFPVRYVPRRSCGCTAVSQEATPETIDFLRRQRRHLARELAQARQEGIDFQRKSWFIPFFARDLNNYADNDVLYCRQIMVNLKLISSRNMYLFLLDAPLQYAEGSTWTAPEEMLLASYCKDGKIVSYYPYDRPKVSRNHPLSEYLNDEQAHQYSFFLLFSGEKQYGLLACDIEQEDFQFFYAVSLQLGLALRYHEIGRTEAAHVQEMSRLIDLMRERNQELDMLSSFDKLTGLLNLRGCLEKMQGLRPKNSSQHAYLIYSDLDHLKEINDTWGHQEGDYAICAAGQILKSNLRDSDILGRIGGDEFVGLILSDSPTLENTLRRRIDDSCRNLNAVSDKPYYVEISLGITSFDYTPDTDIQEIISLADHMLYEHKKFRRTSIRKNT